MKKKWMILIIFLSLVAVFVYLASLSYPPIDESIKNVDIKTYVHKEEMIADIDTLTANFEKIHPNPYRFVRETSFLSKLDSIKAHLPDSLSTIQFWRVADKIVCSYNDAHSELDDRYILKDWVKKNKLFFPLSLKVIDNRLFVSKNENREQILPMDVEIKKINGVNAPDIIKELTQHAKKELRSLDLLDISDSFWYYLWKSYDWDSQYKIHYYHKNDSTTLDSITVMGLNWEKRKSKNTDDDMTLSFKFLDNDAGYMKITDFEGDKNEINDFYKHSFDSLKARDSKFLILDFRGHSGGRDSYGEDLAQYISKKPFRKLSKAKWKITQEFKDAFDRKYVPKGIRWFKPVYLINEYSKVFYGAEPNETVIVNYRLKQPLPEEERFHGKTFLLTDHDTFSAGSIFAEMFKHFEMGTIVGEPTGNLCSFNGFALANFVLPNSNLSYKISSVYNIANNEEEGLKSVEPDYLVESSASLEYVLKNLIE